MIVTNEIIYRASKYLQRSFNKKHFFSDAFQQQVIEELKTNLTHAIQLSKKPRGIFRRATRKKILKAEPSLRKESYDLNRKLIQWLRSQ